MDHPPLFPDLTLKENENRVDFLEFLYLLAGRDNKNHPLCNRYTGLKQQFALDVGTILTNSYVADWENQRTECWRAFADVLEKEEEAANAEG